MNIAILLPLALLGGCGVLPYDPPSGPHSATLTFTSDDLAAQPMICVTGAGFQATGTSLAHKPWPGPAFDEAMKTLKKADRVTTTVASGPDTRVGVMLNLRQAQQSRERCKAAVRFNAQPGAHYRIDFTRDHHRCGLEVHGEDGVHVDAVPIAWRCP